MSRYSPAASPSAHCSEWAPSSARRVNCFSGAAPRSEVVLTNKELLAAIDARHEVFLDRIEDCVNQALTQHLGEKNVDRGFSGHVIDSIPVDSRRSSKTSPSHTSGLLSPASPAISVPAANTGAFVVSATLERQNTSKESSKAAGNPNEHMVASKADQNDDTAVLETNESPVSGRNNMRLSRTPTSPFQIENVTLAVEQVELEIFEAMELGALEMSTTVANPYVKVLLSEQGKGTQNEVFRTDTKKKTFHPIWNASCKLNVAPDKQEILLEVWDAKKHQDKLIGRVALSLHEIHSAGDILDTWFEITPEKEGVPETGKLSLRATLQSQQEATDTVAYFRLNRWDSAVEDWGAEPSKRSGQLGFCGYVGKMQKLVNGSRFDAVFCGFILFNAIIMLCELEYNGRKSITAVGLSDNQSHSEELESVFDFFNSFFALIFTIELVCRLAAFGCKFLSKLSNWLDIIIVAASVIDVLGTSTVVNLTFLRLVRLSKLTRLLKVAMMAKFCEPLRILMKAVSASFGALFWSFILLAMIEIVSALFITQLLADSLYDKSLDLEMRRFIYLYYGTTSRTILTMFQITIAPGVWGQIGRPLIEEVSPMFAWFFIFYVGGVSFVIIRIITALFLRQVLNVATKDEQFTRNERFRYQRKYSEKIRDHFVALDTKGHGHVSYDQFKRFVKEDEDGKAWLAVLELDLQDATDIFDIVNDGTGHCTLDEFLSGVFKLKDSAKQLDQVVLQHEAKKQNKLMVNCQKQLHDLSRLCRQISERTERAQH